MTEGMMPEPRDEQERLRDRILAPEFIHQRNCDMAVRGYDHGGRCDCSCAAKVHELAEHIRLRARVDQQAAVVERVEAGYFNGLAEDMRDWLYQLLVNLAAAEAALAEGGMP